MSTSDSTECDEAGAASQAPTIAIVIPAQDAAEELAQVLPAALALEPCAGIVVVDSGSRDETATLARAAGVRVRSLPERMGPAATRNAGVEETEADVVLFIDADCVPLPDVLERVRSAFAAEPALVSLTGSYADETPARGFLSRYMNLRHHFTHHTARREPGTFWTGCGAVRRSAFLAVGGFDELRFPNGMEDMELGLRLAERGTTRLDPEIQVTHLKRWTLRGLVEAEIYRRAAPWARLIVERGHLPDDLDLRVSQRVAAALAPFALIAIAAAPWALSTGRWLVAAGCLAVIAASVALHVPMLRLAARKEGAVTAAAFWLFHQAHLIYSAATLAVCLVAYPLQRSNPGRETVRPRN